MKGDDDMSEDLYESNVELIKNYKKNPLTQMTLGSVLTDRYKYTGYIWIDQLGWFSKAGRYHPCSKIFKGRIDALMKRLDLSKHIDRQVFNEGWIGIPKQPGYYYILLERIDGR